MKAKAAIIAVIVAVIIIGSLGYYFLVPGNSTAKIEVADQPVGNVSAVFITFTNISLHGNTSGWKNYTLPSKTVNILGVTTTNASLIGTITLSPQKYTMMRIYIQNVTVVVAGIHVNLRLASSFGFINHPFNISAHSSSDIIIEFNLQSDINLSSEIFTPSIGIFVS